MNVRRLSFVAVIFLSVFFLCNQIVFAVEPSVNILGDVVGTGDAHMMTAFNRWVSVTGKTYPVIDGANLRSTNGNMSLIFRDSVRMEVGKNSDIVVNGSRGDYAIDMNRGLVFFTVPKGISFSVKTPTSTIQTKAANNLIQNVGLTSRDDVKGVVSYDGKGTKITAVNGTLMVRSGLGVKLQSVTAGNAIYVEGGDSANVRTAQLAGDENEGNTSDEKEEKKEDRVTDAWVMGVGSGTIVGGYFLVNSLYEASGHD
jgi:hypothetical protein